MAKKKQSAKKIARQKNLPGMTDNKIKAIEDAALAYAEVRDQRMELSKDEVSAKSDLMTLMHKHKKKSYHRGNIHIDLIVEKEKIRVKVASVSEEAEDEPETEAGEDFEPDEAPEEAEEEEEAEA